MGEKALDSKDKGYGMDAPGSSPNYDGYKNNYKALDSKDGEYEMRSILNGYKNKDQKEYLNDPYKREYFNNDPYKREYFNDPYKREYRTDPYKREYCSPCCPGWELDGALCYPQCAGGFTGIGPVCWRGFDSYGQELEQSHGHLDNYRRKEKIN